MTNTNDELLTNTNKLNKLINDHLSNLPKKDDIVKAKVLKITKREILVDIEGFTTGIIRGREARQLPLEYQDLQPGDEIDAMVVDTDNENGQMELSLQSALVETAWRFLKEKEKNQEVLDIKITGANKGGLLTMVKGMPAFLPVSQLIPDHYPHVEGGDKKKILKKLKMFVGKKLTVKIITANINESKVILSEKRAWEELQKDKVKNYKIDDEVLATVKAMTHFGAFVRFGDNLEALIHVSHIPKQNVAGETINLNVGDEIQAKIIDIKGTRIYLAPGDAENLPTHPTELTNEQAD